MLLKKARTCLWKFTVALTALIHVQALGNQTMVAAGVSYYQAVNHVTMAITIYQNSLALSNDCKQNTNQS